MHGEGGPKSRKFSGRHLHTAPKNCCDLTWGVGGGPPGDEGGVGDGGEALKDVLCVEAAVGHDGEGRLPPGPVPVPRVPLLHALQPRPERDSKRYGGTGGR